MKNAFFQQITMSKQCACLSKVPQSAAKRTEFYMDYSGINGRFARFISPSSRSGNVQFAVLKPVKDKRGRLQPLPI